MAWSQTGSRKNPTLLERHATAASSHDGSAGRQGLSNAQWLESRDSLHASLKGEWIDRNPYEQDTAHGGTYRPLAVETIEAPLRTA